MFVFSIRYVYGKGLLYIYIKDDCWNFQDQEPSRGFIIHNHISSAYMTYSARWEKLYTKRISGSVITRSKIFMKYIYVCHIYKFFFWFLIIFKNVFYQYLVLLQTGSLLCRIHIWSEDPFFFSTVLI